MELKDFFCKTYTASGYKDIHRLNCGRIILPLSQPVKIEICQNRTLVKPGEFAVLPEGIAMSVESSAERKVIDFDFRIVTENRELLLLSPILLLPYICKEKRPEKCPELSEALGFILPITAGKKEEKTETPHPANPIDLVRMLADESQALRLFPNTLALSVLNALYTLISSELFSALRKRDDARIPDIFDKFKAAIQFINDNHSTELGLSEIAEAAGSAQSHLSHSFSIFYGISIVDYLSRVRAMTAAHLIALTRREGNSLDGERVSMTDIALHSGFTSSSTFNRVFRKEMGLAPRDYARLCTNDSL